MHLLVGLGNIGAAYTGNRHNIGFWAVEQVADHYGFPSFTTKKHGRWSKGRIGVHDVVLVKPTTLMNRSGFAVLEAMAFFKCPLESVIVFHDELDIPPTDIRIKRGGGAAGHNGLKSIDAMCGNPYVRVRIGIGRPERREQVTAWVLGDFTATEAAAQREVLYDLMQRIPSLLEGQI